MSLILDAIKKSERERQQQEIPGLGANHEDYQNQPQNNHRWRWIGVIIISIVLIVYVVKIQGVFSDNEPILQTLIKTPTPSQNITTDADSRVKSNTNAADTARESELLIEAQKIPTKPSPVNKQAQHTASQSVTKIEPEPQQIINLNQDLRSQLPSIDFSSHVYTGKSATSFVVLNGELLGIGEFFNDDIKIIEIKKDGIVISFQDQKIFIKALEKINL